MLAIAQTRAESQHAPPVGDTVVVEGRTAPARPPLAVTARRLAVPVAIFLAGRVLTLAAAHVARVIDPSLGLARILGKWDGEWYVALAEHGYPSGHPAGVGDAQQSTLAFFPVFPMLIRGVSAVSGLSHAASGVLVNVILGAAASVLIWLIAEHVTDSRRTATRAVVLMSFFPGSFVLAMAYTEGLFLLCAGVCLLALLRERWVVAGLAAAVASATRPTGWLLAVCCAWAALLAFRRTRSLRPFVAPALAPTGFIAFSLFLRARTGDPLIWRESQKLGWDQGFISGETLDRLRTWAPHPLGDFNILISVLTVAMVVVGFVVVVRLRWQLGSLLGVYTLGILGSALTVSMLNSTPRYVMPAFPAYIWLARRLPETAWAVLAACWAGGMALLMVVAGATLAYTP